VAVVIAETLEQAKDAAELVEATYKPLPAVVAVDEAINPGKPQLFDNAPNNICFDWQLGDKAAVETAFTRAHLVTRLDIINNRLVSNPMEPRAAIGEYDRATGDYTLYTTSQDPHVIRLRCFRPAGSRAQVQGGRAGRRRRLRHEGIALRRTGPCHLGRRQTRPTDQMDGRTRRGFSLRTTRLATTLHRPSWPLIRMASSWRCASRRRPISVPISPALRQRSRPTAMVRSSLEPTRPMYVEVKGVFTNTVPVDAYRGAGRPEACYVVERLVDARAR
jgi:carbon-monoxide dehydrogenase large subunit